VCCARVCVCVCVIGYVCTCMLVSARACVRLCTSVCVCACVRVHLCVHVESWACDVQHWDPTPSVFFKERKNMHFLVSSLMTVQSEPGSQLEQRHA
jgi:hypothetical protein